MDVTTTTTTPAEPPAPETVAEPPAPEAVAEPRSQPAQPVLRVTAETTPAPCRSPRQKDPRKVAAGRAGAAARRAKAERLERELAQAKESLRDPTYAPVAPLHSNEEAPRSDKKEAAGSISPWGVGALVAAAGLAYWAASRRAPVEPPPKEKKPPVLSQDSPAQQLKVKPNPHYME